MDDKPTLAQLSEANIERAKLDRNLAYTTYPETIFPVLLPPCIVRMLVVTDGEGSFGDLPFGLDEFLNALSVSPGPWVQFTVTTAHRSIDGSPNATPDISNFRFDRVNLNDYDVLWLFGVLRVSKSAPFLDDTELAAIARFMDAGGGVFSTGDHEDLGRAMSARVPRVRNMRKWYYDGGNDGPQGEPSAPPRTGRQRHDTLRSGHEPFFSFYDQSDDIPQTISPKMYWSGTAFPWLMRSFPHPLLCGPLGVINVLPDHMHEGECYVPPDLDDTLRFADYEGEEYPRLPSGKRLAPEVIAWSTVLGRGQFTWDSFLATGTSDPGPVDAQTFGAIGVYDGHQVGVGRVVVDSTWHHFFHDNLVGDMTAQDPVQQQGFPGSAQGRVIYERIKAYYRNLAVWLARSSRQFPCQNWPVLWALRWHSALLIEMRPSLDGRGLERLDLPELLRVGAAARGVLRSISNPCQTLRWQLDLVDEVLPDIGDTVAWLDPWRSSEEDEPDPASWIHGVALLDAALGGAMYAIADQFPDSTEESRQRALETDSAALIREGLRLAIDRVVEGIETSRTAMDDLVSALRREYTADGNSSS